MEETGASQHVEFIERLENTIESEVYRIRVWCENSIGEANDSVNFFVDFRNASADFVTEDILFDPENPRVGEELEVTGQIMNIGDLATAFGLTLDVKGPNGYRAGEIILINKEDLIYPWSTRFIDFHPLQDINEEGYYNVTVTVSSFENDLNPENNIRTEVIYVEG